MEDKQLFRLIEKIANMAYEYSSSKDGHTPWFYERRINPFYKQTQQGFFIELYYGAPSKIWTPWGKWSFWITDTDNWDNRTKKMLERLGAVEFQPLESTIEYGDVGPVYSLSKVDEVTLPKAMIRSKENYLSYEQAHDVWNQLKQNFLSN